MIDQTRVAGLIKACRQYRNDPHSLETLKTFILQFSDYLEEQGEREAAEWLRFNTQEAAASCAWYSFLQLPVGENRHTYLLRKDGSIKLDIRPIGPVKS